MCVPIPHILVTALQLNGVFNLYIYFTFNLCRAYRAACHAPKVLHKYFIWFNLISWKQQKKEREKKNQPSRKQGQLLFLLIKHCHNMNVQNRRACCRINRPCWDQSLQGKKLQLISWWPWALTWTSPSCYSSLVRSEGWRCWVFIHRWSTGSLGTLRFFFFSFIEKFCFCSIFFEEPLCADGEQ